MRRWSIAAAVMLAGCAGLPAATTGPVTTVVAGAVPADMLNPAVTQATIGSTICVRGYTATIRPPTGYTEPLKLRQLATYGYGDRRPGAYEEDHVESLEAGGAAASAANLYPESHSVSFADDQVENATRADICSHRITLASGQLRLYQLKVAHGYNRSKSLAGA